MEQGISQNHSRDLLTWAKILISGGCPLEEALATCPLNDIMKLTVEERIAWVEQIQVEDMEKIVSHHQNCIEQRIAQKGGLI